MNVYAFDFWDFNQPVAEFFLKYLAIIASVAIVTHYGLNILQFRRPDAVGAVVPELR